MFKSKIKFQWALALQEEASQVLGALFFGITFLVPGYRVCASFFLPLSLHYTHLVPTFRFKYFER